MQAKAEQMRVLHIAPIGADPCIGLFHSIPALVEAQQAAGAEVELITTDHRNPLSRHLPFAADWWYGRSSSAALVDLELRIQKGIDLAVFHSTYLPVQAKMARVFKANKVPYIITPRAGMTALAGSQKRWKKRLGNWLFFNRMVRDASAIHCLTGWEAAQSRHWKRPLFVVGNGIDLPDLMEEPPARLGDSPLRCTFIGRLAPWPKGLDVLLEGIELCVRLNPAVRDAFQVRLYGPATPTERGTLQRMIDSLRLENVVSLHDPVHGEEKRQRFLESGLFLHPSRFEGHPMAVLEALAHGVPCLVSPPTGMTREILHAKAGWAVDPDRRSIAQGLAEAIRVLRQQTPMAESNRCPDFRRNARNLAQSFSWEVQAAQTLDAYSRIQSAKAA